MIDDQVRYILFESGTSRISPNCNEEGDMGDKATKEGSIVTANADGSGDIDHGCVGGREPGFV